MGVFTHFHEDHIGAVTKCIRSYDVLITHPITFKGIAALKPGIEYLEQWAPQEYGTTYRMSNGLVRLLKANHIPGSSQVYVESEKDTMLYSGDFNYPDIQTEHAEYLVLDANHGDPYYDGKTDRKSVKNRLFEDVDEFTNTGKSLVIQTSSGTLQEIVRHFEVGYGKKLSSDVHIVMDEKQRDVLECIYDYEKDEFRHIIIYDSREFWRLVRENQKCIIFSITTSILPDNLRSFYKIIIDKYRFTKENASIIPFNGGCRYNLAAHASINDIYRYVEAINPKYVITDGSRSGFAKQLAKLVEQKFPKVRSVVRPLT